MYILSAIVKAPAVNNVGEGLVLEPGDSCFIKDADAAYYQRQPGVYIVTAVSPAGLSTVGGVTSLVGPDGTARILFNSHLASAHSTGTQSVGWYVPAKADLTTIHLDTHGLIDLAENVIENPYYGVSDCYVRGVVSAQFVVAGGGTYRTLALGVGATTAIGTPLKLGTFLPAAYAEMSIQTMVLSSAHRYCGLLVGHDIGATANVTLAAIELEFFL